MFNCAFVFLRKSFEDATEAYNELNAAEIANERVVRYINRTRPLYEGEARDILRQWGAAQRFDEDVAA
jgi:hypothetical protein